MNNCNICILHVDKPNTRPRNGGLQIPITPVRMQTVTGFATQLSTSLGAKGQKGEKRSHTSNSYESWDEMETPVKKPAIDARACPYGCKKGKTYKHVYNHMRQVHNTKMSLARKQLSGPPTKQTIDNIDTSEDGMDDISPCGARDEPAETPLAPARMT